jgi:hypothetical protein
VNAGTLRLAGDDKDVLKTLAPCSSSRPNGQDHILDVITGFQASGGK